MGLSKQSKDKIRLSQVMEENRIIYKTKGVDQNSFFKNLARNSLFSDFCTTLIM